MLHKKWLLLLLIPILFLEACTRGSSDNSDECIIGIWEVANKEVHSRTVIPFGAVDQSELKYLDGNNELAYKFGEDGVLSILAVNWTSYFEVITDQDTFLLDFKVNGIANAEYSLDGNTITIGPVTDNRMIYEATLDGEQMVDNQSVDDFSPLFMSSIISESYECSQDTLSLRILNLTGEEETLTFIRTE
jgi:hypothetical protein